ncbi:MULTISPECIES: hypothetical protein [unclassified Burkholderia]|uniref:hypothetical protein n=1 Tax=unclassified Burkholderia TaxID=2613784 RepID=UPI001146F314|nr:MULTISPECIES: hypothetical protein [unclassified Burkholderia]
MDTLLRETDQRMTGGLWIGDPPALLQVEDLTESMLVFGVGTSEQRGSKTAQKMRALIEYGSSGPYVHVGVILLDSETNCLKVFEAGASGVQACPLDTFRGRYRYIAAYEQPALLPSGSIEAARRFARRAVDVKTPYSRLGALLAPLRQWRHQRRVWKWPDHDPTWSSRPHGAGPHRRSHYFCSQFVIDTIRAAGVRGFETNFLKSTCYTPMMLAESPGLLRFVGFVAEDYMLLDPRDPVIAGTVYARHPHLRAKWGEPA